MFYVYDYQDRIKQVHERLKWAMDAAKDAALQMEVISGTLIHTSAPTAIAIHCPDVVDQGNMVESILRDLSRVRDEAGDVAKKVKEVEQMAGRTEWGARKLCAPIAEAAAREEENRRAHQLDMEFQEPRREKKAPTSPMDNPFTPPPCEDSTEAVLNDLAELPKRTAEAIRLAELVRQAGSSHKDLGDKLKTAEELPALFGPDEAAVREQIATLYPLYEQAYAQVASKSKKKSKKEKE